MDQLNPIVIEPLYASIRIQFIQNGPVWHISAVTSYKFMKAVCPSGDTQLHGVALPIEKIRVPAPSGNHSFYGIHIPDEIVSRHWSRRFITWIESIRMEPASGDTALKVHLAELSHLRQIMVDLSRAIRALATTEEYRNNFRILRTVPGISMLTAMTLLTELYDITRFRTLDKLCGYVGLTPDTHGSGEKQGIGDITRRCNQMLRSLLIECSWTAVRKDPALALAYHCYCQRTRKTKAVVKITRKLLNRIRFVLNNHYPYVLKVA